MRGHPDPSRRIRDQPATIFTPQRLMTPMTLSCLIGSKPSRRRRWLIHLPTRGGGKGVPTKTQFQAPSSTALVRLSWAEEGESAPLRSAVLGSEPSPPHSVSYVLHSGPHRASFVTSVVTRKDRNGASRTSGELILLVFFFFKACYSLKFGGRRTTSKPVSVPEHTRKLG